MTPAGEFEEMEGRLRRRPMPALPLDLRDRVFADTTGVAEAASILNWRAASLAAAVLVALNVLAMGSNLAFAGVVVPRILPPAGISVASTDAGAVAPRFGSPWLPCDLPGGR